MLWLVIAAVIVIADQFVKYMIVSNVNLYEEIPVINNFFYITYIRNAGAAWGIMQGGRPFFIVSTVIVLIVIFIFFLKIKDTLLRISLVFISGGAIGNFIDRFLHGSVVDFLQFRFGSYVFPNFNIADSCVVIGTIILFFYVIFFYGKKGYFGYKREVGEDEEIINEIKIDD